MATHFIVLAWRIPWTEEPGGLQSIVSQSRTRLKGLGTACRYNEYTSWDCLKALLFCGLDQTNQLDFHGFLPGGRDTAGLGGKGGPYRLDAGHTVYQVSQAEKDAVPEEVKRAAREMGQRAFQQRWVVLTMCPERGNVTANPGQTQGSVSLFFMQPLRPQTATRGHPTPNWRQLNEHNPRPFLLRPF